MSSMHRDDNIFHNTRGKCVKSRLETLSKTSDQQFHIQIGKHKGIQINKRTICSCRTNDIVLSRSSQVDQINVSTLYLSTIINLG